jgi:hypothetical protein
LRRGAAAGLALVLVVGFHAWLARIGAPQDAEKEALRRQFRLPPEVALTKVRVDRKPRGSFAPDVEGIVVFSEAQFREYVGTLDDPAVWKPVPLVHGGRVFAGPYSADALRWEPLPGRHRIAWVSLSWKQAQEAKHGRHLCFAVQHVEGGEGEGTYRGLAGWEVGETRMTAVYVQGLIDYDRKTLHMLIRGKRGPSSPGFWQSLTR